MKLTEEQIKEIAENLDLGMRCYYNLKTGEIVEAPDNENSDWAETDTEPWKETFDDLEQYRDDYFEFERMTSLESYKIMEDFAHTIDNQKVQDNLFRALNKPKPFKNFKWHIDNSGEYRQKWFNYKTQRLIEFVKSQIEQHNQKLQNK
jgi:hypothetical protein